MVVNQNLKGRIETLQIVDSFKIEQPRNFSVSQ